MNVRKLLKAKILGRTLRPICRMADQKNVKVYLVGGPIRDLLLKRPIKDIDICVESDAIQLALDVSKILNLKTVAHSRFQTATLFAKEGRIDLATARKEYYTRSGALPVVSQSFLADDLFRRDFTINAMAVSLNGPSFGDVIDPYQGSDDLKNKWIRVLHEKSFIDDPTRLLRAVRFEQRFDFRIERKTSALLKQAFAKKLENNVTPQRYFAEFRKILLEQKCLAIIQRLKDLKGLSFISGSKPYQWQYLSRLEKSYQKHLWMKEFNENQRAHIYLMALVDGVSDHQRSDLANKLPLNGEEKKVILQNQERLAIIGALCHGKIMPGTSAKILRKFKREVVAYWYLMSENKKASLSLKRFLTRDSFVQLKISGSDVKRLGGSSGPEIGKILDEVLEIKIDQRFTSRSSEVRIVKDILKENH